MQRRLNEIVTGAPGPGQNEVTVPADFYYRILSVGADDFACVMRKVQPHLSMWWQQGDTNSLRRSVDHVLAATVGGADPRPFAKGLIEWLGAASSLLPGGALWSAIVSRAATGGVAAESTRRVVEYLVREHPSEEP